MMHAVLTVLEQLRPWRLTDHQIRAEAWALGARHQGQILDGARTELGAPKIAIRRAILLRAVIRSQAPKRPTKLRRSAGER